MDAFPYYCNPPSLFYFFFLRSLQPFFACTNCSCRNHPAWRSKQGLTSYGCPNRQGWHHQHGRRQLQTASPLGERASRRQGQCQTYNHCQPAQGCGMCVSGTIALRVEKDAEFRLGLALRRSLSCGRGPPWIPEPEILALIEGTFEITAGGQG